MIQNSKIKKNSIYNFFLIWIFGNWTIIKIQDGGVRHISTSSLESVLFIYLRPTIFSDDFGDHTPTGPQKWRC